MRIQTEFVQVSTATDTETNAKKIAKKLLEKRIASCVEMLGPVKTGYWWKGKIEYSTEWLCLIKGRARDYLEIESIVKIKHPYEVPEIIAIPILSGNPDYLQWIRAETKRPSGAE